MVFCLLVHSEDTGSKKYQQLILESGIDGVDYLLLGGRILYSLNTSVKFHTVPPREELSPNGLQCPACFESDKNEKNQVAKVGRILPAKPLPASIPLLIHLCSESPNLSRMLKALLSACLLLALLSAVKPEVQIENTCLSSRYCFSGDYSFTAADGKFFEMKMQCCNTDLCNNETLSLPDRNMLAENGLQCPSCFSKGKEKCKSETIINCLENETQCVDFRGAFKKDTVFPNYFTFQGCATTNFCAIRKNGRVFIGIRRFILSVYEESCYNASRISHQPEQEG
ncbi:uncharacterized protein LOC128419172 [Podarcis raffonei]|uniref:uncharacterized protein LOC128419172 n=1 Tax=Podarcis raffonei TaxID=65483 RepID=UPI002329097E|nr:uncharacterized protein LOC128419172 [Podarcis raffonei]